MRVDCKNGAQKMNMKNYGLEKTSSSFLNAKMVHNGKGSGNAHNHHPSFKGAVSSSGQN